MLKDILVQELYLVKKQMLAGDARGYLDFRRGEFSTYSVFVAPEGIYLEGAKGNSFFPWSAIDRITYLPAPKLTSADKARGTK